MTIVLEDYRSILEWGGEEALRLELVAEARTWLDTPFKHQQRRKGEGVDCIGVPAEVGKAFAIPRCDDVPFAYTRAADPAEMQRELESRLDYVPFRNLKIADLLWMLGHKGGQPQHLAMVVNLAPLTILHASMRPVRTVPGQPQTWKKTGQVIEHSIDDAFRRTRVRACFRYRCFQS